MTKGEFNKLTSHLPDDIKMGLVDLSTDDIDESNYDLTPESVDVVEGIDRNTEQPAGKILIITFQNKMNPHPLK